MTTLIQYLLTSQLKGLFATPRGQIITNFTVGKLDFQPFTEAPDTPSRVSPQTTPAAHILSVPISNVSLNGSTYFGIL